MRTKKRSSVERHDVLHEGAVDLEDVDVQVAQVAERRVARSEIVDRDADAEVLDLRDAEPRRVDVVDEAGLRQLDDQPPRQRGRGAANAARAEIHSGWLTLAWDTLTERVRPGSSCQRVRGKFQHALVEHAA